MPTRPLDQPCEAAHSTICSRSRASLRAEVVEAALGAPGPAQIHHHDRVAARGEVPGQPDRLAVRVARLRQDSRAVAVGQRAVVRARLEDDGEAAGGLGSRDLQVELLAVERGHADDLADALVARLRQVARECVVGRRPRNGRALRGARSRRHRGENGEGKEQDLTRSHTSETSAIPDPCAFYALVLPDAGGVCFAWPLVHEANRLWLASRRRCSSWTSLGIVTLRPAHRRAEPLARGCQREDAVGYAPRSYDHDLERLRPSSRVCLQDGPQAGEAEEDKPS